MTLKIIYIGDECAGSTSRHRADALSRLGYTVQIADPYLAFKDKLHGKIEGVFHYYSGYRSLQSGITEWIQNLIDRERIKPFDMVWVDSGELLGSKAVEFLSLTGATLVFYNHDDPTGKRDGRRFDSLLKSLALYDLCVVVRKQTIGEFQGHGARNVIFAWRSYDEVMHAPYKDLSEIQLKFHSDVAFIGTWMRGEGRDRFLLDLVNRGVPVAIWGQRWEKSPLWAQLRPYYRGGNLSGRDYVAAIQASKVCLGMLSKGNRDLHTTRSMEIPYAGGVLCAERTSEHMELYKEGVEAVFWRDSVECARQCHRLLDDEVWRESVRRAGMVRVRASGRGHEDMCRTVIEAALKTQPACLAANPR